jgi:hypothetical protein
VYPLRAFLNVPMMAALLALAPGFAKTLRKSLLAQSLIVKEMAKLATHDAIPERMFLLVFVAGKDKPTTLKKSQRLISPTRLQSLPQSSLNFQRTVGSEIGGAAGQAVVVAAVVASTAVVAGMVAAVRMVVVEGMVAVASMVVVAGMVVAGMVVAGMVVVAVGMVVVAGAFVGAFAGLVVVCVDDPASCAPSRWSSTLETTLSTFSNNPSPPLIDGVAVDAIVVPASLEHFSLEMPTSGSCSESTGAFLVPTSGV